MSKELDKQSLNDKIDLLEVIMGEDGDPIDFKLDHTFAKGWYIRGILMPKSEYPKETIVTSMVHNTIHPYFVLSGKVAVVSENDGEQILEAGYHGITIPNTRRVLRIIEDTYWVTVHQTDIVPADNSEEAVMEAVRKVEESILQPYENRLLEGHFKDNKFIPEKDGAKVVEDVNTLRYD